MPEGPTEADLERIIAILNRYEVNYVMVGGAAAQFHGATRPTRDIDVVTGNDHGNLTRLGAALQELNAKIRGAEELPDALHRAQQHPDALRQRQFGNWTTDAGDLDTAVFIGTSDNPISYEALWSRAQQARDGELVVVIASLADIIAAKEAADRPKDHEALPELRALQDALDAQS